jgi:hypothetical protein
LSYVESQTVTGSRSNFDCLQAAFAQLKALKSDSALATPSAPVYSGADFQARDAVRLTKDFDGTPSGSEGVILGWYSNDLENVIVSLSGGGVKVLPREALELIEAESATWVFRPGCELDEAELA